MKILWLIRHEHRLDFSNPEWFDTARYRYDPPLSPLGLERAKLLGTKFKDVEIERIYTSPFLRTIQTAAPIAVARQRPIQLEWGLCEWLCREWTSEFPETTPVDELRACYPNIDRNYASLVTPRYPETVEELDLRVDNISYQLAQSKSTQQLAIAHKGSVLGIAAALTKDLTWRSFDLPCGGIIKLEWVEGERWHSQIVEG
jgi:broad specificity phosphatase PhoE